MDRVLTSLLEKYQLRSPRDWEQALREILQHLALLGLWRGRFFEHAAFYGGTALRLFHGLPRFSEDLDFTLTAPEGDFDFNPYIRAVDNELIAFGFNVTVERREKRRPSPVESAFITADTITNLLYIEAPAGVTGRFHREQRLRIRFEIDTDPPGNAAYHVQTLGVPVPFQVKLVSEPCLFAGKIHALLFRQWKSRIKGRDFFDFAWFIGRGTPCSLSYLSSILCQAGTLERGRQIRREELLAMLMARFESVDINKAREDVRPFVDVRYPLELWNKRFFLELTENIITEQPGTIP